MAAKNTSIMSISLPKAMKERIKERVAEEQYGTPSDYIRTLVREDLKKQEGEAKLEKMLLDGVNSGPGVVYGTKEWRIFKKGVLDSMRQKGKQ